MIHKTPAILKRIYPNLLWEMPKNEKKIYVTFDDGPIPEITEEVLAILKQFHAKATFFCIGDNIRKYPEIFKKVVEEKHGIGNHTFHHQNGWKTSTENYIEEVEKCQNIMEENLLILPDNKLFRPPYGRIKKGQIDSLTNDYQIVMWSVLSMDYDAKQSKERCTKKTIEATNSGSIVVFHDSQKASKNLLFALPKFLQFYSEKGYKFDILA